MKARTPASLASLLDVLAAPLRWEGRLDALVVFALVVVNSIAVANALLHDPTVGYDATQHLRYVFTLATGRLPTPADSTEFFSPPLPYVIPAALLRSGLLGWWGAARVALVVNAVLSLGITWGVLALASRLSRRSRALRVASVLFLGILPVYFKTLAFLRGEPFVAFFMVLALEAILTTLGHASPRRAVGLGLLLGLLLLSRQWGLLVVPPFVLVAALVAWKEKARRAALLGAVALSLGIAGILAGSFYVHLFLSQGSFASLNRPATPIALSNEPREFYLGLGLGELFTDPVRPAFANELLPIYYSEVWGDYWGFFIIYARDLRTGGYLRGKPLEDILAPLATPEGFETNRHRVGGYLGRVNAVGLFPSALALLGLGLGLAALKRILKEPRIPEEQAALALLSLLVVVSLLGYLVFLLRYPDLGKGDTIKASYLLHMFPVLAILAGQAVVWLEERWRWSFRTWLVLWGLVFFHTLPAMITRHRAGAYDPRDIWSTSPQANPGFRMPEVGPLQSSQIGWPGGGPPPPRGFATGGREGDDLRDRPALGSAPGP